MINPVRTRFCNQGRWVGLPGKSAIEGHYRFRVSGVPREKLIHLYAAMTTMPFAAFLERFFLPGA